MKCEECGGDGAQYYVDYTPQGNVVHQFDPDIWELCPACAAETTYVRPDEYIEFLEACLEDEKLKQINSKWDDQGQVLDTLIRWLIAYTINLAASEEA